MMAKQRFVNNLFLHCTIFLGDSIRIGIFTDPVN